MIIHTQPLFTIYFGQADDGLSIEQYKNAIEDQSITAAPFANCKKRMHVEHLMFLRQTHSILGSIITSDTTHHARSFGHEGDYLITNTTVGLGILTADCLPIIFYDSHMHVAAIAHAGWRGTVKEIAKTTLQTMQKTFNTKSSNVQVIFGPSAKSCCYTVSPDFIENIDHCSYANKVFIKRGADYYFDVPGLNRLQLLEVGIKKEAIGLDYNICTMCNESFNSYRRQGESAGRQMTVVCVR